jgi:hypothetical protein
LRVSQDAQSADHRSDAANGLEVDQLHPRWILPMKSLCFVFAGTCATPSAIAI